MADVENRQSVCRVVDFINHAVISDADPPSVTACKFSTTGRSRIGFKRFNRIPHPLVLFLRQIPQLFLCAP